MGFMLRLKGESDDAAQDDRLQADPEEQDQITSRDAFPDGVDAMDDDDSRHPTLPLRGLVIAGATFVPTFLLVFFGVPYLLSPDGPIHSAIGPVRSASESPRSATTSARAIWAARSRAIDGVGLREMSGIAVPVTAFNC